MRTPLLHLLFGVTLASACAPSTRLAQPSPDCSADTPRATRRVDSTNVLELVGSFDVLMLNTVGSWGAPQERLLMSLRPTDSTPTQRIGIFPGPRPLHGTTIYQDVPGGKPVPTTMIGFALYIGEVDMVDGSGDRLTVTDLTADGFRGTWMFDGGLAILIDRKTGERVPDPKGIFCARRRG